MIFEVAISAQADADLRNIYEHIAFELQSPIMPAVSLTDWKKVF